MELARPAGLAVERGILADEHLLTNMQDVYAAGDVAQVYDPRLGRTILDSLWGAARDQGRTAGLNMAGREVAYIKSVPCNITRLAGLTTTIIGAVGTGRDADLVGIARGDSESWRDVADAKAVETVREIDRVRLLVGERTLIGAVVMGDQLLSLPLEKMVAGQLDISPIRSQLLAGGSATETAVLEYWQKLKKQRAS